MSEDLKDHSKPQYDPYVAEQIGTAKFLDEYFSHFDKNKDNFVTVNELLQASADQKFMAEHAKEMSKLVASMDVIRKQSFDFYWFQDNPSISSADATNYGNGLKNLNAQLQAADVVVRTAPEIFPVADINKDGNLDKTELETYLTQAHPEQLHQTASYLEANMQFAGHVTDSQLQVRFIPVMSGKTSHLQPVYSRTYIYGINRDDVAAIPSKIKDEHLNLIK